MNLENVLVKPNWTIRQVMQAMDANGRGIALVVDADQHLLATVTDGDIRRAILQNLDLTAPLSDLLPHKDPGPLGHPVTAAVTATPAELRVHMQQLGLRHIPLLDETGRVVDLARLEDLIETPPPMSAVVMAGGLGTRLRPLTEDLPKPMLPIGGRPLIEHIVTQLREAGVQHLNITTHYKPETIREHFGDGQKFGLAINYLNEEQPLGTAGALGLMPAWEATLLVVNGDILTRLNYRSMVTFHQENQAVMTVGVRPYDVQVPYGVVETDGVEIRSLSEKPTLHFFVNAGVYLLEPEVRACVPHGRRFDMTDLINQLLADGRRVVCFPINEYWLDIGQHADYARAQADFGPENKP